MFKILYNNKFWLFGTVIVLSLLSLWPILKLNIDNSVEIWFYEKDPGLKDYLNYLHHFGSWDYLVIAVNAKHSIYDVAYLKALRKVNEKIQTLGNVVKVTSIANAKDNFQQDDGLSYKKILADKIDNQSAAVLKKTLEKNSIFVDGLIKQAKDDRSLMLIQVANRYGDKRPYRIKLMDQIHDIMDSEPVFAGYDIVGTPNMNAELNKSSKRDMEVFYPLVSLFVILFAWLIFRSLRDIIVTFSVVLSAIIISVGTMMALGYELNMVTIMMGAILMSLSVASVVHLITSYHQIKQSNADYDGILAAKLTVKELWTPALGASLTTMMGFLSLTATKILPVTLLGVFSAFGIFLAYVLTMSLGAVLLPVLWKNRSNPCFDQMSRTGIQKMYWVLLDKVSGITTSHYLVVVSVFCVVGGLFLMGLFKLEADSNYLKMFKDQTKINNDYHSVEKSGFGTSVINLQVNAPQGVEEESVFRGMMRLQQDILKLDHVRKVISPVDIIREVDKAFAENPDTWKPGFHGYHREAFAQLILTAESSGNDDLSDYLSSDHKQAQIAVFTDYLSGKETTTLKFRIRQLVKKDLRDQAIVTVTGVPVMWANMDNYLFKSQSTSLMVLAVAIFIVLVAILRSIPLALIGLSVNLLPIGMILGLMGHLDVKINMATILIGGIAMGIAVDDTIHFLWRYKMELQRGNSHMIAVKNTLEHIGIALVMTSVLIIGGFTVMMVSDFTPTADFGLFTSVTVLLALLADLLLLPSLLSLYQWKIKARLQFA